jgi:hypothetical protein
MKASMQQTILILFLLVIVAGIFWTAIRTQPDPNSWGTVSCYGNRL